MITEFQSFRSVEAPGGIESRILSSLESVSTKQSFEKWLITTWLAKPILKMRCDCPGGRGRNNKSPSTSMSRGFCYFLLSSGIISSTRYFVNLGIHNQRGRVNAGER